MDDPLNTIINTRTIRKSVQLNISLTSIVIISGLCYLSTEFIGYKTVALILLLTVSILAVLFDIVPVMISALLSALIWNFFFIPPLFTFHVDNTEDFLLFIMYFVIALVNAVLTYKIRKAEKIARDREEKNKTINLYNTLMNSLSHEMRTPLSAIIGAADTLKENDHRLTATQKLQLLDEIEKAGIRLNRHVENLLNMNRLESGMLQLKRDWCDLYELIFSVIHKTGDEETQKRIHLHISDTIPLFRLDAGLIEQALANLVQNALQYTPESSIIKVTAAYQEPHLTLNITDEGPGIPVTEHEHIFEKFYRLPHTQTGGTGLGLSIVKGIIEAHGGTISVDKRPVGSGTGFTIHLPAETSFLNNLKNE